MYHKSTAISGYTASGEFKIISPHGHWKIENAIRRGRKAGMVGPVKVRHDVYDGSGRGRSGHDGRWIVNADDTYERKALWSEFGREHK